MSFLLFSVVMFFILSGGDISRAVLARPDMHYPPSKGLIMLFNLTSIPCAIGVFLIPVYGFFVLPWWQPIVGLVVASILVNVITRRVVAGSPVLYLWSSAFGVAATVLFSYSVIA